MTNTAVESQVDKALDGIPERPPNPDPDTPQTPFPSSLEMTREQEDAVVDHVMNRLQILERDMGRHIQPQGEEPAPDETTWMGRRETWTLRYYNHVADRARKGTIFEHSNLTASLAQRITMQMIARANNFFFATDPWFNCAPVNHDGDTALEDRIDRHLQWKMREQNLIRTGESANEFAFVRGEAVTKTTYVIEGQRYKRRGNALHSQGELYPDGEGNPIFDDATWIPEMAPADAMAAAPEQLAMAGAQPVAAPMMPTGREVLKSDGVTPKPDDAAFVPGLWPFRTITREGSKCDIVYFKDFLCPLDAPTIHEADINIHIYSVPVMRLVEMFRREDLAEAGAKDLETMQRAVSMIRQIASDAQPHSAANQPRGDHGERGNTTPDSSPDTEIVEAWVRYDVDGDGVQEEIMIAIDRRTRFPVFYDYTANLTAEARRPFEVVRSRAVDGRWYGIGAMEYFEPEQEFVDLLINRRNFRMSQAGRITWWNPSVTVEGLTQPHLPMNFGKTYTLREGYKGEDLCGFIELPDDSENLMELLNFYMQLMQLKSGVINAGDQEASGLPSSNTATGINDVAKSGQEMFSQYLNCLMVGQQDTLRANVLTTYKNMNRAEVFRFFAGDTAGLDHIEPDEVKHLKFLVTILLTRQQTEKVLQTSAQALALIDSFLAHPPEHQAIIAPFFRESYSALGYSNAEQVFVPMPPALPAPGMPGDPNAQGPRGVSQGAQGATQAAANTGAPAAPEPPAPPAPII